MYRQGQRYYVVFGPNVTIYSGDHITSVIGKHISEISQRDKEEIVSDRGENVWDKDVLIESGCWIGTQALILKGVTIGKGSIIGASAIVTKNIPPYSIYVGSPDVKIKRRFTEEEIEKHEQMLVSGGPSPNTFGGILDTFK